jgi:hypothetical protein
MRNLYIMQECSSKFENAKIYKKNKPSWANLKQFKPWSKFSPLNIREKLREKFTRKNSAVIHEIADENHVEDVNFQVKTRLA